MHRPAAALLATPHRLVGRAHVLDVDKGIDAAALLKERQGLGDVLA